MKLGKVLGLSAALCLGALPLAAQETNNVEQLKKQLQELQQKFQKQQAEQRQQIEALQKQLEALLLQQHKPEQAAATNQSSATNPAPAVPFPSPPVDQPWSPSQPISLGRAGSAYMNVSFDALMDFGGSTARDPSARLQLGDHDPIQRGFSLRNAEIALDGAVDPYLKGFANIVFKLEKDQSTTVELEETYLQSVTLPANLQLKAGQFFANFGRQNAQHPHVWEFVDQPLVLNRAFGPDGLRNIGGQLSWLLPTPFYTEVFLGVLNGQGGTAFSFRNLEVDGNHGRTPIDRGLRGAGDLLYVPRIASSFDLTDQQTLVVGASAAFGPNDSGPHSRTEVYGVDAYWKWKSAHANQGFPFVSWQTEALYERFGAGEDVSAVTGGFTRNCCGASNHVGSPVFAASSSAATMVRSTRATFSAVTARAFHRISPGIRASFQRSGSNTITIMASYSAPNTRSGCRWNFSSVRTPPTSFKSS